MQSLVVLMFLGLARPPLTQAQVGQLETATDHTRALDEPALYPLLNNAVKWQASDELGAIIPDFGEMLRSPAIYRGKVFLIEGQLAGKPRPIQRLSRPGAWDRRLEQWGVLVGTDSDDVVIVLYLVEPPSATVGQWVRSPARFYKVWTDVDQQDRPTDYLVFVGHSGQVSGRRFGEAASVPVGVGVLFSVVVLLAVAYLMLRVRIRRHPPTSTARQHRGTSGLKGQDLDEADEMLLPSDPASALDELQRHGTTASRHTP